MIKLNENESIISDLENALVKMAEQELDVYDNITGEISNKAKNGDNVAEYAKKVLEGIDGPSFADTILDAVDWNAIYKRAARRISRKYDKPANPEPSQNKIYPSSRNPSPYERTRSQVYATGNKWAIDNFNATH